MSSPNPSGLDAYKPSEIAPLVEAAGVAKARLPLRQMLILSMLAGAFIALGAAALPGSILHNIAVVTLGNVIGGAGGVALSYRLAYGPR